MTEVQQRCVQFGQDLLNSCDLDPLYVMLATTPMPPRTLGRFLLAYGMYYHAGVACKLAEARDFWQTAWNMIPTAPRGTERRHFRGKLAEKSIKSMWTMGEPEAALSRIYPQPAAGLPMTFRGVFSGAQSLVGFGPWIAFKMADIGDRTGYAPLVFEGCELSIYDDPVKGAALWRYGDQDHSIRKPEVGEVCEEIRLAVGRDRPAPPLYDRPINIQEVETILCKFKSHTNGHYPMGKDTKEIVHGLAGWGPLADQLAACPLL
jgi:hypothetical protein